MKVINADLPPIGLRATAALKPTALVHDND
jgi:hypothetical protein